MIVASHTRSNIRPLYLVNGINASPTSIETIIDRASKTLKSPLQAFGSVLIRLPIATYVRTNTYQQKVSKSLALLFACILRFGMLQCPEIVPYPVYVTQGKYFKRMGELWMVAALKRTLRLSP